MKKLLILLFSLSFLSSPSVFAGDDLTGKGLWCYAKDLIIYLDFNSPYNVDVHYLQRYNADYVTDSYGLTKEYFHGRVKYRYKHRAEKYLTTNRTIDIDYFDFHRWIRVNRESLKISYKNWWQNQQDINKLFPFSGGYIQKNDVLADEQPISCRVENNLNVTEVIDFIKSTAQNYNNKIESSIIEQKKKEEEESRKVNKI